MGLFKKARTVVPAKSRLDSTWFGDWSHQIAAAKHLSPTVDLIGGYLSKACMVIDHDCRDYVGKHAPNALTQYVAYYETATNPWDLVSFVVGCNPGGGAGWVNFIETDVEAKLTRFAQILIDPSVAQ